MPVYKMQPTLGGQGGGSTTSGVLNLATTVDTFNQALYKMKEDALKENLEANTAVFKIKTDEETKLKLKNFISKFVDLDELTKDDRSGWGYFSIYSLGDSSNPIFSISASLCNLLGFDHSVIWVNGDTYNSTIDKLFELDEYLDIGINSLSVDYYYVRVDLVPNESGDSISRYYEVNILELLDLIEVEATWISKDTEI